MSAKSDLDVLNISDGSVVGSLSLPNSFEDFALAYGTRKSQIFLSQYLKVSKKVSFVKKANTKGISDISGTTRKPFKQKGTGKARQGSLRSPQFRGGATIFGPIPQTAAFKINKKERKLARALVLAGIIRSSLLRVVEDFSPFSNGKTKVADAILKSSVGLGSEFRHVLLIDRIDDANSPVLRSVSGIHGVSIDRFNSFRVYEVVTSDLVVITKSSLQQLFTALYV